MNKKLKLCLLYSIPACQAYPKAHLYCINIFLPSIYTYPICKDALQTITPIWMNISLAMKKDPQVDKAFGWVLEM